MTLVAHDIGSLGGGMEVQLVTLVRGLLAAGWTVTVIARRCDVEPHPRLTIRRVRTPARPFPVAYPLFAIVGGAALKRHRRGIVQTTGAIVPNAIDCVSVHFCHAAYSGRGLAPRASAPGRLFRVNSWMSNLIAVLGERWSYRPSRTRAVIAVSAGVQEEVRTYFPALGQRIRVIPHGVDGARFKPDRAARLRVRQTLGIAGDSRVAVFVGGDWRRKGLAHAIEAIARIADWQLLVVGKGQPAEYQALAQRLGAADRVIFAGETRDVPGHLAAGDIFLLPTLYETFCLVAFEAAAAGLPVLTPRVSGPDTLIEPDVNGEFLTSDVARTSALVSRYSEAARRHRHGAAARAAALQFTWERATAEHVALYEALETPV
ncbi:MAG: hypothetical protein NVS3B18_13550 [Candidatus Dormibacteria bacterium]